ncbi:MAG: hypothetical protein ACOH5I_05515 [Oligoflexus sp.]
MFETRIHCLKISRLSWFLTVMTGLFSQQLPADPHNPESEISYSHATLAAFRRPALGPRPAYLQQISHWLNQVFYHPEHQLALLDIANQAHQQADPLAHEFFAAEDVADHPTNQALHKSVRGFAENTVRRLSVFDDWNHGLRFTWDWGTDSSSAIQKSPTIATNHPPVRYGLVLQDIQPSSETYLSAAINQNAYGLMNHAPKAKVTWTIGPIRDQGSYRPYQTNIEHNESPKPSANNISEAIVLGTWQMNFMQPKFRGVVKSNGPMNQVLTGSIPNQIVALEQSHQIYALEFHIATSSKPGGMNHRFMLPISEKMSYMERLNQKQQTIERCLKQNFGQNNRFASQLTFYPQENRWSGDLSYQHAGVEWSLVGNLPGVSSPLEFLHAEQARYELRLIHPL